MIAKRFTIPVIFCFTLALIPTIIHSYIGLRKDDGKSMLSIPEKIGAFQSKPTRLKHEWVKETFDSDDWIDRIYTVYPGGERIRFFAANSYDHKRLYHHPELALSHGKNFTNSERVVLKGKNMIPVSMLMNEDKTELAAYAMMIDDDFVVHPIRHQLFDAIGNLFSGRRKMSLFYVSGSVSSVGERTVESKLKELLINAINHYEAE